MITASVLNASIVSTSLLDVLGGWLAKPDVFGFYVLSAVAVFASLRVIVHHNPVHAILSMIVSLLAVAGIFFILGAAFAGALQIIVYAGAILVLFVFVIMMLNLGATTDKHEATWLNAQTWAVPTGLSLIIAIVLVSLLGVDITGNISPETTMIGEKTITAQQVGERLFSEYMLLVEVAAMLLLAALVAAYHLGKKALDDENISHTQEQVEAGYQYQEVQAKSYLANGKNRTDGKHGTNTPHKEAKR